MMRACVPAVLVTFTVCGSALAADTQVALNYNFNGMVHAGESGVPDSFGPSLFRAIADRALAIDGSTTAPVAFGALPLVGATGLPYSIVQTAGTLDLVMLGNRALNRPFDTAVPGTLVNQGIQPDWLPNVDQTGPQVTTLPAPILLGGYDEIGLLYHVASVSPGATASSPFTVTLGFTDASPVTVTVQGRDWFGSRPVLAPVANSGLSIQQQMGIFKGATQIDQGTISATGNELNVWEAVINVHKMLISGLGDYGGKHLSTLTFQYPSPNPSPTQNRNYAIFAATVRTGNAAPSAAAVPLNYNFNGMVHGTTEQGADNFNNANGYRAIADRGLLLLSGAANAIDLVDLEDGDLTPFTLVREPGVLDIVHLGNRMSVANSARTYGTGGNNAAQPDWQTDPDQTGPQITNLASQRWVLGAASRLGVLYQISDAGGRFDTTLRFSDSSSVTVTMRAADWFNSQTHPAPAAGSGLTAQRQLGVYAATDSTDMANTSVNNLNVVEAVFSVASLDAAGLGNHAGKRITALEFSNPVSNSNYPNSTPATGSGVAIIAATLRDVTVAPPACPADLGMQGGVAGQDGMLDNNDFVVFINHFFNLDPRADHGSQGGVAGPDGMFDNNDFVVYINEFFNGCGA